MAELKNNTRTFHLEIAFLLFLVVNKLGTIKSLMLELAVLFLQVREIYLFLQAPFFLFVSCLITFSMDVSDILACQEEVLLSFILEQSKLIYNN